VSNEGGTIYKAEWHLQVGGRDPFPVRFMIRADRYNSIFKGTPVSDFGLPGRMFAALPQDSQAVVVAR
jgi:hypothetical protein